MVRKEYEHKVKLINGLPVLYCKFGKNKPWVNITSSRFNITHFSFIDKDNNTHSIKECEITNDDLVVRITFSFDLNEILFDDVVIWNFYYSFWSGYPKYILFRIVKNKFKLVFDHGIERFLDIKIQYISRESGGTLDIGKYENDNKRVFRTIKFKNKFSIIGHGDEDIWERLPGEPYPENMVVDQETGEVVIFCHDRFFVCRRENGKRTRDVHKLTQFYKDMFNLFDRNKQASN